MFCSKCNKSLVICTCEDCEKRLESLRKLPSLSIAVEQNIEARKIAGNWKDTTSHG